MDKLHDEYGIDTSENAMRRAIDDHNKISRIITEIGNFRKADNPNITGYEFHVIQLVSQVCPHRLILPYLAETLEELKTREAGAEIPVPRESCPRRLGDRRPGIHKAHRDLRRHGRG